MQKKEEGKVKDLKKIKETDPETGQSVRRYRDSERNQLANLMLLTREENGPGGKGDMLPSDWFNNKDKECLDKHLIPDNPALWSEDRFDDFIIEKKNLFLKNLVICLQNQLRMIFLLVCQMRFLNPILNPQ